MYYICKISSIYQNSTASSKYYYLSTRCPFDDTIYTSVPTRVLIHSKCDRWNSVKIVFSMKIVATLLLMGGSIGAVH